MVQSDKFNDVTDMVRQSIVETKARKTMYGITPVKFSS